MKILFCDIDGTLTETISGHTFKQHPKDVKIIEGADKAIAHFARNRCRIIGISNQGGIAKGFKSLEETIEEMRYTLELLPQLIAIYFCPDFEGNECYKVSPGSYALLFRSADKESFRKPGCGMLQLAANLEKNERSRFLYLSSSRDVARH